MITHNVEQGTDAWFKLRAGIPTTSNAKLLVTSTGKASKSVTDYAYQLAGEQYAGKMLDAWDGNEWTERGSELEEEAMVAYIELSGKIPDLVGFCTIDDGSYGCSPDGLIVDENGMFEIKCLMGKNHVKNMVYYNKHKKAMPDYIPQTQMQLLVCERDWCDLVFYHPDLPMLVIRQEKIKEVQDMLIKQLAECIKIRDKSLSIIKEIK